MPQSGLPVSDINPKDAEIHKQLLGAAAQVLPRLQNLQHSCSIPKEHLPQLPPRGWVCAVQGEVGFLFAEERPSSHIWKLGDDSAAKTARVSKRVFLQEQHLYQENKISEKREGSTQQAFHPWGRLVAVATRAALQ